MLVRVTDSRDKHGHIKIPGSSMTKCGKPIDTSKTVKGCELCDKCVDAAGRE